MLDKNKDIKRGQYVQIFTVISATFGAIADGMHYTWSAPVGPILKGPDTPTQTPITDSELYLIEIMYMIGGIAGLPITIFLVDRLGRKPAILISAVGNLISWLMLAFAAHVEVILAAQFLCGMTGDMQFVAGPMYIAEIADKRIRGLLCGIIYLALLVGIVVMYSIGPFVTILISSIVGMVFVVLQIVSFSFMPESPYFYLKKHKEEKSKKALTFLRGGANVREEMKEIEAAVRRQESERGRPIDLLIDKGNRKATIIMTVLNGAQHFSSISIMLMNLHTILAGAEGIIPTELSGIIFSIVMLISAAIAICVVDRFGRRILLIFSSLLTGFSLAILATYFAFKDTGYDVTYVSWVPVLAVLLYAFAFKCGLGLVPIVMTGELFPTSVKAIGMTVSDAAYVFFGAISLLIYQWLEQYGLYTPFYVFSVCCIATAVFVFWYVPETNGKTLEEIQFILKGIPMIDKEESTIRNENEENRVV